MTGKLLTPEQAAWWERVFHATIEKRHKQFWDVSTDGRYALIHVGAFTRGVENEVHRARWFICTFKTPKGFGKPEIVWEINAGVPARAMQMRFADYGLKYS